LIVWLRASASGLLAGMHRIAPIVDRQNAGDTDYLPLIGSDGPGLAFDAARQLILDGVDQPNGYTEPILHRVRRQAKQLG
jgi:malate synthase